MRTIQYNNKAPEVRTLCEMLNKLGYNLIVSDSFTKEVDAAAKDFQLKNNLVVDGIIGIKSWSKLFELNNQFLSYNSQLLSENDLIEFSQTFGLELATVKAVNEVESSGKGFLVSGKPKILFEGHVFWKELEKRGINPDQYYNATTKDVLYPSWTKNYYLGGDGEYTRMEKAMAIVNSEACNEAALSSASWGAFQIMGYHAVSLGYGDIHTFVQKMYLNEREHLYAFGQFLKVNHLLPYLQNKQWADFALHYNGAGYKTNKYDEKLYKAYMKYA